VSGKAVGNRRQRPTVLRRHLTRRHILPNGQVIEMGKPVRVARQSRRVSETSTVERDDSEALT